MVPHIPILLASALIPFILGYIWFHPALFGGETWYKVAKLNEEDRQEVSKLKLLSTLILNALIAFGLYNLCVHQMGVFQLVGANADLLKTGVGKAFLDAYGSNHLSFGHGLLHGSVMSTLCFAVPILGYVTIFEKKSLKYFFVYLGYWCISLGLMGGVLCQWAAIPV